MYKWFVVFKHVSNIYDMFIYGSEGEADTYNDACRAATQKIIEICGSGEFAVRDVIINKGEL